MSDFIQFFFIILHGHIDGHINLGFYSITF